MNYGVTDLKNAQKELQEEYGIDGVHLEFVCCVPIVNEISKSYLSVFLCDWDGDIKIQEEEVQEHRWVSLEDLKTNYVDNPDVKVKPKNQQNFNQNKHKHLTIYLQ